MTTATETCVHHWMIESPRGPTSKAKCKKCGVEREFANFIPGDIKRGRVPSFQTGGSEAAVNDIIYASHRGRAI